MNLSDFNLTNNGFEKKMDFIEKELQNSTDYLLLEKRKSEIFKKIKNSASFESWLYIDELVSIKNEEFIKAAELFYIMGAKDAFGIPVKGIPNED